MRRRFGYGAACQGFADARRPTLNVRYWEVLPDRSDGRYMPSVLKDLP